MPVSDYEYMLRAASAGNLTGNENCVGVKAGAAPYDPIKVRVYVPASAAAGDTLDIHFEEGDTLGGGYDDIQGATMAQITGANAVGTYEFVLPRWTKPYIRAVCTVAGAAVNYGAVTIGFTPGQIATT